MAHFSPLNRLLFDISVYLKPELFNKEWIDKIKMDKQNIWMLNRYNELISAINWSFNKVLKYKLYFEEFYPVSINIPEYEALEYHIHSYLEDLTILKNKIEVFLNSLKTDISKVADNKEEVVDHYKTLVFRINKIFKGVKESRDPHHHKGWKFLDADIVDAEGMSMMTKFNELMPGTFGSERIEQMNKRAQDSFELAKTKRVALAIENNKKISDLIDELFSGLRQNIYKLLNIKPMEEFLSKKSKGRIK